MFCCAFVFALFGVRALTKDIDCGVRYMTMHFAIACGWQNRLTQLSNSQLKEIIRFACEWRSLNNIGCSRRGRNANEAWFCLCRSSSYE